jgi:hypothetical protein
MPIDGLDQFYDSFVFDENDERQEIIKMDDEEEKETGIQITRQRRMSFDFDVFNDESIYYEAVEEEEKSKIKTEHEVEDDEGHYCRYAVAKEMVVYIHKMNNSSAWSLIDEVGTYDKAIENLTTALELLQAIDGDDIAMNDLLYSSSPKRTCSFSLDGCIEYSEQLNYVAHLMASTKKKKLCMTKNIFKKKKKTPKNDGDIDNKKEDLHRRPILIPKKIIGERHGMGSSLFLLITFNLALAHHLKILKKKTKIDTTDHDSSSPLVKTTIRLYEIILDTITDDDNASKRNGSKIFTNIVANNLKHLKEHHVLSTTAEKIKTAEKRMAMKVENFSSSFSLYEEHKELVRNRYASHSSSFMESTSSLFTGSSSNLEQDDSECFSMRLKNAMRTSSSFGHLQSSANICSAYTAL